MLGIRAGAQTNTAGRPADAQAVRQVDHQPPGQSSRAPSGGWDTLHIDPMIRFEQALRRDSLGWLAYLDSLNSTPLARMRRNMDFPSDYWMPTAADSLRRIDDINRALDHGFLYPEHPRVQLFSISPSQVLMALGVTEDVTPWVKYTLLATQQVTVRIYDLDANLVATLVDDVQAPGKYSMKWDFRDQHGIRVHYGDYIAEVVAADSVLLRKRIVVP